MFRHHEHRLVSVLLFTLLALGLSARHVRSDETLKEKLAAWHVKPPFAWNRSDKYEPPNFEVFFPDDPAAGKQLDLYLDGKLAELDIDDRLALIRCGLRHTSHYKTSILGSIGNQFVWNKDPQDPRAIELLYHASAMPDGGIAHFALYHGPTVVSARTPNLVRMLMEQYQDLGWELQGRIPWGMKTYGDKEVTRKLLLDLLAQHESLEAGTTSAALVVYESVFDQPPPDTDRFHKVGKWVIAFHREDLSASHPRAAKILHETVERCFRGRMELVLDYVTRVDDGHETAVVVLDGYKARSDLARMLPEYVHHKIDRNEFLSARTLRECRLRELSRHLPGGLPLGALPAYTRPAVEERYAFNAAEFVPPDYAAFFEDDPEAGKQLDQIYANHEKIELTDRQLLELFRKGVRRSKHPPNSTLGWISSALGWPKDPLLTEIFYQALDPKAPEDFYKAGVYYGFGLGTPKTKNILTALFNVYMAAPFDQTTNGNMRSRITWGVGNHEDDKHFLANLFEETLRNPQALSDPALRQAEAAYKSLTGSAPPNAVEYASRGVYLVLFEDNVAKTTLAAQKRLAARFGDRKEVLTSKFLVEKGEVSVLLVVRGKGAMDSILKDLTAKRESVHLATLLTPELIEQSKGKSDLLTGFEKYLPQEQCPCRQR